MSRLLTILCALALLTAGLAACGDDEGGGGDFETDTFSVDLPDRWKDETDSEIAQKVFDDFEEKAGVEVEPEAALVGPPRDRFAPNLIVIQGETGVDQDAPEYVRDNADAENKFAREHPDLAPNEELRSRERTFEGEPAVERDFVRSTPAGDARERQLVVIDEGTVHYLSFTALEKTFDEDVEKFEEMLDSWSWK